MPIIVTVALRDQETGQVHEDADDDADELPVPHQHPSRLLAACVVCLLGTVLETCAVSRLASCFRSVTGAT